MTVAVRVTMGVVMTVGMGMRHEIGPEPVEYPAPKRLHCHLCYIITYRKPGADQAKWRTSARPAKSPAIDSTTEPST